MRKATLGWIFLAKRQETRQKQIDEIVESTRQNLKPVQLP
jgi:uncharacterized protein YdeI (YjbR/CyaY-like superfamily)